MNQLRNKTINTFIGIGLIFALTACEGIFDDIYDTAPETVVTKKGQFYIEASDWGKWYYIDFDKLPVEGSDSTDITAAVTVEDIPTEEATDGDGKSGVYTYLFDVWGVGISKSEKQSFTQTVTQPEPDEWTIAIHREVVRTNGCAVLETSYTSFDDLPESSSSFADKTFTEDEWSENAVWVDQSKMLQGLIGCQGIYINKVLSGWYTCEIPPFPPKYTMRTNVYILRLPNGKYAALQLANALSPEGTKCCFTVNYKYPY